MSTARSFRRGPPKRASGPRTTPGLALTQGATLAYLGHTLMENRNGLMVDAEVSSADGHGERDTAHARLSRLPGKRRKTVGADKGYDTQDFVVACRDLRVTPHIARNTKRRGGSALDGRTTRHAGYGVSLKIRKRIEEGFGWNLTRIRNLQASCAQ